MEKKPTNQGRHSAHMAEEKVTRSIDTLHPLLKVRLPDQSINRKTPLKPRALSHPLYLISSLSSMPLPASLWPEKRSVVSPQDTEKLPSPGTDGVLVSVPAWSTLRNFFPPESSTLLCFCAVKFCIVRIHDTRVTNTKSNVNE